MTPRQLQRLQENLQEFTDYLTDGMGRTERREAMRMYMHGLLLDGDRKSTEPMAARLAAHPDEAEGLRQRLQQCVSVASWAEDEVYRRLAQRFEDEMSLEAYVIDDTGFPKKGKLSVGVGRQYSGTLGRTDNCQVAVSLHVAGKQLSGCIGLRLYLPDEWAKDKERRKKAGVPTGVRFQEKWRIALELLERTKTWELSQKPVLADAGYGDCTAFRESITALGLPYLVGVSGTQVVWLRNELPERPRTKGESKKPVAIRDIAPYLDYKEIEWRNGSYGRMKSRFAATRATIAHGHDKGKPAGEKVWVLCEWPAGESAPTKFYVSSLPEATPLKQLVNLAKMRWRVERDYQEMKEELGLDHFEGRTWTGFHHHAALCAASHGFLALQRALFPPD